VTADVGPRTGRQRWADDELGGLGFETRKRPTTYRGLKGVGLALTLESEVSGLVPSEERLARLGSRHRTVRTALLLVVLPLTSLTVTAKSAPLSSAVVGGVV